MAIQDDLDTTIAYAKSLGVTLSIERSPRGHHDAAEVCFARMHITIWTNSRMSKREILVSLLHELGHLKTYLEDRKLFNEYFRVAGIDQPCRDDRWQIYERERLDIARMLEIADRLELGVPRAYIRAFRDYDTWQYWFWWKTGRFPLRAEKNAMRERLAVEYGLRYRL